jgi:hypothetical protein
MTTSADIVWNAITDSAKKKFDYSSFEEQFIDVDENLADNLLFKIIIGFASKKTDEIISLELFNEMMMIGFIWKLEDIQDFIKDKDKVLKSEIYSSQLAGSLLEDGNDPLMVLNSINQLLN